MLGHEQPLVDVAAQLTSTSGATAPPFEISEDDRLRLKLRDSARRLRNGKRTELPSLPGVQSLSIATRYIDGGRERFIEFVQLTVLNGASDDVLKWWAVYADLTPRERDRVSFDDVCAASGVKPSVLLAAVISTAMEAMNDVGNLVAALVHPAVVDAAAKSAVRIDGEFAGIAAEDRKELLRSRGLFLPPKGTSIHLSANASAQAAAASTAASEPSVPSFLQDAESLTASRQRVQRQLAARDAALDPIDVDAIPQPAPASIDVDV